MIRTLDKVRPGFEEPTDVAAFTTLCNARMHRPEKRRRREIDGGIMTHTAVIRRRYMRGDLRGRDTGVVTGFAIVHNPRMVECRTRKTGRQVTNRAILDSGDVVGRQPYGACRVIGPVMAGSAIGGDSRVIENRRNELGCRVADNAILGGRQVVSGFTAGDHFVVTGGTIIYHAGMIINAAGKGTRGMA